MSIRRTGLLLLAIVALTPGPASATGHNADLSGDGTVAFGSKLWGFHEMFAKTLPVPKPYRDLSFVGDLSIYKGTENTNPQTVIGHMVGVRWTIPLGTVPTVVKGMTGRLTVSPYGLVGAFYTDGAGEALSAGFGGAIDVMVGSHSSSEAGWGGRARAARVTRRG